MSEGEIVESLTILTRRDFRGIFKVLDLNGDGFITETELLAFVGFVELVLLAPLLVSTTLSPSGSMLVVKGVVALCFGPFCAHAVICWSVVSIWLTPSWTLSRTPSCSTLMSSVMVVDPPSLPLHRTHAYSLIH